MIPRQPSTKHHTITLQVEGIDATLESVKDHDGKVTIKKTPAGTRGFFAYFGDSDGNVMGSWQTAGKM